MKHLFPAEFAKITQTRRLAEECQRHDEETSTARALLRVEPGMSRSQALREARRIVYRRSNESFR
jgi:hypothetical protein